MTGHTGTYRSFETTSWLVYADCINGLVQIAGMVSDDKKDIVEYETAAKAKDSVGQYAAATLPALKKHLESAQSIGK
jgi:hypothetical protein